MLNGDIVKQTLEKLLNIKLVSQDVSDELEESDLEGERKWFSRIINHLEKLIRNEHAIYEEYKVDMSTMAEPYWDIIEDLINFTYEEGAADLIWWYVHERKNAAGKLTKWEDEDGKEYEFKEASDLFDFIVYKYKNNE